MEVLRILAHEAFEEGGGDVEFGQAGDDVRVEFGHVGAQAAVQDLRDVAGLHG